MPEREPETELQEEFSTEGATALPWPEAESLLEKAEIFWLSTVRTDGQPHVTPLLAVWQDGVLHFCTGEGEQKAKNLEANAHCVLTTGCNVYSQGVDLVVEGEARRVMEQPTLVRLAAAWESKYGADWHFEARDGAFQAEHGEAIVFGVAPKKAFGYSRGPIGGATRWRF
jgi:general stress protein 26